MCFCRDYPASVSLQTSKFILLLLPLLYLFPLLSWSGFSLTVFAPFPHLPTEIHHGFPFQKTLFLSSNWFSNYYLPSPSFSHLQDCGLRCSLSILNFPVTKWWPLKAGLWLMLSLYSIKLFFKGWLCSPSIWVLHTAGRVNSNSDHSLTE